MQAERSQKKMLAMAAVFAASASYAHAQAAGGYTYIAGYEPRSTVVQHANIDKDVRDIISALPSNNGGALSNCDGNNCKWHADTSDLVSSGLYPTIFDTACAHSGATVSTTDQCLSPYGIWKYGKYSLKESSVRSIGGWDDGGTIRGFGAQLKAGKSTNNGIADVASGDNPFIGRMNTYWAGKGLDRQGWGYDIVEAAFKGTSLANNVFNFTTVGMDFRKQVIQKGLIYLNIFPYVIWEMQDAVNDCNDGDLTSNDAPYEALPSTRGMRPLLSTRVVSRVQTREVTMIYFHVPMVTASSCYSSQTTVAKITARVLLIQMVMHLVVTPNSTRTSLSSSNEVRARSPPLMLHQAQPDKPSATQFRPLWKKLVQRC